MSKMKRNNGLILFLISAVIFSLNGCTVRRETGGTSVQSEKMPIFQAEYDKVDLKGITEVFIGMEPEDAYNYAAPPDYSLYEGDGVRLSLSKDRYPLNLISVKATDQITFLNYENHNENAYHAYGYLILDDIFGGLQEGTMRQYFPEEELEWYSKEDVIEACRPYAEACGYMDTEILTYAVTLDILEANSKNYVTGEVTYFAPDPTYKVVTEREIWELETQLEDMEAGSDEYNTLSNKIVELREQKRGGETETGVDWEKNHEAYILTFQERVEGFSTMEEYDALMMIYVPMYEAPIYVKGTMPLRSINVIGETAIVSAEKALREVLLITGYDSNEMTTQEPVLVYAPQYQYVEGQTEIWMIPCWSIECKVGTRTQNITIDARTGRMYQKVPSHE